MRRNNQTIRFYCPLHSPTMDSPDAYQESGTGQWVILYPAKMVSRKGYWELGCGCKRPIVAFDPDEIDIVDIYERT